MGKKKSDEEKKELMIARDYKVVKANSMIQTKKFSLSAQESKILAYAISKIKPGDTELPIIEFSLRNFCKVCGINERSGGNYEYVKKTIKDLGDKSMWISIDEDRETLMRWIDRAEIDHGIGTIRIRIHDLMKPYLLELRNSFTQYELIYILVMRSQYSIRLYELLKSYAYQREKEYSIEELRATLNAEGYSKFNDFKRFVLDMAVNEISLFTDLKIDYELHKTGRQYTSITFNIRVKKAMQERMKAFQNINDRLNGDTPAQDDGDQLKLW